MGFLFVDGFDYYQTFPGPWAAATGTTSSTTTRFSLGRSACIATAQQGLTRAIPGATCTTLYAGVAFRWPTSLWMGVLSLKTAGGTWQVSVGVTNVGKIRCCTGQFGSTPLTNGDSVDAIQPDTWHHLEAEFVASATVGTVTVKLDGVTIITASGNTGTGYGQFVLGNSSVSGTANQYYDDLWVHDTAFQGDCRIIYRAPEGAGNYAQFDPSVGANWECVNEAPPDTGDYVSTTVTDEIDSYAMQDIAPSVGTVKAVVGNYYCQKTDAGSRQLDMLTRLSNVDLLTGVPQGVPSSWGFLQFIQEAKPGGGAWTVQNTKDAEMGMKLEV